MAPRAGDREPLAMELCPRPRQQRAARARSAVHCHGGLAGLGPATANSASAAEAGAVRREIARGAPSARTRFSGKVSAHRVVELVGVPMADIRKVRQKIEGATINDIFMTIVGGALNKYLDAKGELPDRSMTAQIPMTLRGEHKGKDEGNHIGVAVMPLHTEIAAPLERLHAIGQERQGQGDGGTRRQNLTSMSATCCRRSRQLFTKRSLLRR
jgi:hypothetical protein